MTDHRAQCTCGQLSATCRGEPFRVSVCHCLACKRRTGSAFSWNARWRAGDVTIEGVAREYVRIGDDGSQVIYSFCPECGVTVHYRLDTMPGAIAIRAGGFANKDFQAPRVSVYHESRGMPWVEIRADPLETNG
jgi:hypothetical protein